MSRTYLIVAFLFTFLFLRAQVQISDIQEIVKNDAYTKQFANVDGEDYIIEDNDEFTKISKITDTGLQLIHKLNYRPFSQYRRNAFNYICKSNDALLYQNRYLIQMYSKSVYLIDVISGELYKKFDSFDGTEINLASNNVISNDKIVLRLSKIDGSFSYISLNLMTSEIKQIDFEFNNHSFFIDGHYYTFKKNKLSRYTISTETSEDLMSYDSLSGDVKFYYVDCSMRLCFKSDGQYYYLNDVLEIVPISCNVPDNIRTAYVRKDVMAFNYVDNNIPYTKIINLSDCSTIFDSLELKEVHFFNLKNIGDDFLIATYSDHNIVSHAEHYLINTHSKKINEINSYSVELMHYDAYVHNNKIYISGWINMHYSQNRIDLHRIDLSNVSSEISTPYGSLNGVNIQLGKSSKEGVFYFIAASVFGDSELYKIQDDSITKIFEFDTRQNLGILDIGNKVAYKDNFYYATLNGIYSSNANGTSKIFSIEESTNLVRHGSFIYSIVKKAQNEIGFVKIDLNSQLATFKKIPYISSIRNIRSYTEYGFINDGENQWPYKDGFFDFKTETYIDIKFNNNVINIYSAHCSGHFILIRELKEDGVIHYLFNSANKEIKKLENIGDEIFGIISLNDGSYYLERQLTDEIFKLDSEGNFVKVFDLPANSFYEYEAFDKDQKLLSTLLYSNNSREELLFLSKHSSEYTLTSLPYKNSNSGYYKYWRAFNEKIIVQIRVDSKIHTYFWNVGESPVLIDEKADSWKLNNVIPYKNWLILFYYDFKSNAITIKHFNTETRVFTFTKEVDGILPYPYPFESKMIQYSENSFYITVETNDIGVELWSYNADDGSLELVKDIYSGHIGSNPTEFLQVQDNIFFMALADDRSRQWYTIKSLINSTIDENPTIDMLEINPNPVMDQFTINRDLYNISIFDAKGNLVFDQYHMEQGIRNSFTLNNGFYFIVGYDKAGRMFTNKIIKL